MKVGKSDRTQVLAKSTTSGVGPILIILTGRVVFVGDEVAVGVVEVVDPGLAGVEVGRWEPLGAAVFPFSGAPAGLFDELVVGGAGQGERGDIGGAVVGGPAVDMVGFTPVARRGAAGSRAATVTCVEHDPLSSGGQS